MSSLAHVNTSTSAGRQVGTRSNQGPLWMEGPEATLTSTNNSWRRATFLLLRCATVQHAAAACCSRP